ncbi:hypothetical protein [Mesorhizobium sp.]|uniref:hypothetical protein n=1 Tax=Mesorhizobium sp. TaxID=1871066 RepID=UPI0012046EBB|nr:hypothetical protein [Mesorhizobium sp.]TIO30412.1 MAG: hypothetical protein E5X89_27255 [Mesorhizobium sp.]
MVSDNRTWVHPNAIRRGEKYESGRYLHYFRHWHSFTMKMDDYRFIRWVASHNTNNRNDDPAFDTAAKKLSEQGWEALSREEQEAFAEHQVKYIGAETPQDGVILEGWGRLEGGLGEVTITAFAVDNDPHWRSSKFDDDYEKTFRKVRVTVLSAAEEHPGALWVWGESMREYKDDDMMGDEDVLCAQFYMLPEKLKALAREVAAQPARPTLTLHAQGLTFQDEVEASLSEPWHPHEYVIIYDHHHQAILNSIRFEIQAQSTPASPPPGTDDDAAVTSPQVRFAPTAPAAAPVSDAVAKNLRGVKYALWILAAAIMLAAVIR